MYITFECRGADKLRGAAGACLHAMGRLAAAYAEYDTAFGFEVPTPAAQETLAFRNTAYYQGEICVYLQKKLDAHILHFSIDRDLDPEFKEMWAKQQMPTAKLLQRCPKQIKKGQGKFPADRKDMPLPAEADLVALTGLADGIGRLLQYTHQGALQLSVRPCSSCIRKFICSARAMAALWSQSLQ
jgi:hypothetical protein